MARLLIEQESWRAHEAARHCWIWPVLTENVKASGDPAGSKSPVNGRNNHHGVGHGYSSVMVTSTRASIFGGVSRSKSQGAWRGHYRPAGGQIVGNEVSPENAMTETGPERLGAGFWPRNAVQACRIQRRNALARPASKFLRRSPN